MARESREWTRVGAAGGEEAGEEGAGREVGVGRACPEKVRDYAPDKPHCYDAEIQAEALAWFDRWLKGTGGSGR